ncbi:MotA/TolQ/ExbB proton channel family protein [Vulcanococcus limneticus Candia 3F8]|uniref:MotA/TolQ/ExbB proton channel family protein n=1 Tax=Vulcanococcus limneticus TaxID=2170428 RepID=UPI000B99C0F5|nr:MotA/TolQ/ExbB proton channel family protein [Vulcanococcus limneticus]MCP9792787.1 MotA/TolQ/ExbB proton channel family protein [Vulcanococcus limneticus MW73D5]MCP9894715.1 MotA/TolQ/ExbB proton channel family protein [Vulcanococcus limneticus Candia 3F8]MCP9898193.1 MotA/TolQ/ExbB proton channel family protein [Vulcanococcus limneticus Candia 3B3]
MSLLKACGPVAIPLALLSLAVFTIAFERVSFWWRWWRPPARQRDSLRRELAGTVNLLAARLLLERRQRSMAFGEPVLQAAVLLAPLLGLVGTVLGLMGVLRELGPQLLLPPANPLVGYADVLASTVVGLELALAALALLLLNQGLRRWQRDLLDLELRQREVIP